MMGLFDDAAASISDAIDGAGHIANPTDFASGILTPLRLAVQGLFEDWLRRKKYSSCSDVWRAAKARAEFLGLEWRLPMDKPRTRLYRVAVQAVPVRGVVRPGVGRMRHNRKAARTRTTTRGVDC